MKDKKKWALALLLISVATGSYLASKRTDIKVRKESAEEVVQSSDEVALPPMGETRNIPTKTGQGKRILINKTVTAHKSAKLEAKASQGGETILTKESLGSDHTFLQVTGGVDAGHFYVLPVIGLNYATSDRVQVGMFFTGAKNFSGQEVSVYGAGFSGSYFFTGTTDKGGFNVESSLALYSISGNNGFRGTKASPVAVASTVGWSGELVSDLHAGIGLGAQYAFVRSSDVGDLKFRGVTPLLRVRLGYDLW